MQLDSHLMGNILQAIKIDFSTDVSKAKLMHRLVYDWLIISMQLNESVGCTVAPLQHDLSGVNACVHYYAQYPAVPGQS